VKRASPWDFLESGINPACPKINDVKTFTQEPSWRVDVGLQDLARFVDQAVTNDGLDLDPDFQRGHVWTEAQQIAFMEFMIRRGRTGRDLYFNSPDWPTMAERGQYVIVDGKQRLTAALRFVRGEIPVFGYRLHEFKDSNRMRLHLSFGWNINSLRTRAEVLTWYLEFNSAGTPHTTKELDRVRALLEKEKMR
jgi:hypothetical protein